MLVTLSYKLSFFVKSWFYQREKKKFCGCSIWQFHRFRKFFQNVIWNDFPTGTKKKMKKVVTMKDQIWVHFISPWASIHDITTILGGYKIHIWRLKKFCFFAHRAEISASTNPQFWPSLLKKWEFSQKSPYFAVGFKKPKNIFFWKTYKGNYFPASIVAIP